MKKAKEIIGWLSARSVRWAALFVALGLAGGAWAATPVAVWDGNFSSSELTKFTGYELVDWNQTHGENNSTVTIDRANQGLMFRSTTGKAGVTVLVRYSNLSASNNNRVLFTTTINNDYTGTRTGIRMDSNGALRGIWGNTVWNDSRNSNYGSVPASGVMAFTYSKAGTYLYSGRNADRLAETWNCTSLMSSADTDNSKIRGVSIGGYNEGASATGYEAALGMTIDAVAVFDSVITLAEMQEYTWPSEESSVCAVSRTVAADATVNWTDAAWTVGETADQTFTPSADALYNVTVTVGGNCTIVMPESIGAFNRRRIKFVLDSGVASATVALKYSGTLPESESSATLNPFGDALVVTGSGVTLSPGYNGDTAGYVVSVSDLTVTIIKGSDYEGTLTADTKWSDIKPEGWVDAIAGDEPSIVVNYEGEEPITLTFDDPVQAGSLTITGNIVVEATAAVTFGTITAGAGSVVEMANVTVATQAGTGVYRYRSNYPSTVPNNSLTYEYIGGETSGTAGTVGLSAMRGTVKTTGFMNITKYYPMTTASTLDVVSGTTTITSAGQDICGNIIIREGATLENTVTDALAYSSYSSVIDVYGTLNMGTSRWTVWSGAAINLRGGEVVGVGEGNNGALDFMGVCNIHAYADSTISGNVKFRNALSNVTVDDGVTLTISGATKPGYDGGGITKKGNGTLKFTSDPYVPGGIVVEAGKLAFDTENDVDPVVTYSSAPSSANMGYASASNWKGMVVLGVLNAPAALPLDTYGNANSKIVLKGTTGNCYLNGTTTVPSELVIDTDEDDVVEFNNGSSGQVVNFTKISGAGTLKLTGWTGCSEATYNINTFDNFTGTLAINNAIMRNGGGTFTIGIGNIVTTGATTPGSKVLNLTQTEVSGTTGTVVYNLGNAQLNGAAAELEVRTDGIYVKNRVTVPAVEHATVSVVVDGVEVGIEAGDYSVAYGSDVTVTYTAVEGYLFGGDVATRTFSFDDVSENKAVTAEAVGTTSAVVAKIMPAGTPYSSSVENAVLAAYNDILAGTAYVQVIDDTGVENGYGAYGIGYDATAKKFAKAVATIGTAGYLTAQEALDVAASGAKVFLAGDNSEELTLANGKTVTIKAKQGPTTYTYTAPVAENDTYTVDAADAVDDGDNPIAGEKTYTARNWYSWVVTVVAPNATVAGVGETVSEATPTVQFTVTPDADYKVTSVTVDEDAVVADGEGKYSYKFDGPATITVATALDEVTFTLPVVTGAKVTAVSGGTWDEVNGTVTAIVGHTVTLTWDADGAYVVSGTKSQTISVTGGMTEAPAPAAEVVTPTAAVAQDDTGRYYGSFENALGYLYVQFNQFSNDGAYVDVIDGSDNGNAYADYKIGCDAAGAHYAKVVTKIGAAGYLNLGDAWTAAGKGTDTAPITVLSDPSDSVIVGADETLKVAPSTGVDLSDNVSFADGIKTSTTTEGGVTTYTARDWYDWTVTVVAENATVTDIEDGDTVSEANPYITFTVAAAETYKVTSVQVNGTVVGTTAGEYNATLNENTTITVTTELDTVTVTIGELPEGLAVASVTADGVEVAANQDGTYTVPAGSKVVVTWANDGAYTLSTKKTTINSADSDITFGTEAYAYPTVADALVEFKSAPSAAPVYLTTIDSTPKTGTYKLLGDISRLRATTSQWGNTDVTFDLNGHTWTCTETGSNMSALLVRGTNDTVTVTDTSVNGGGRIVVNGGIHSAVRLYNKAGITFTLGAGASIVGNGIVSLSSSNTVNVYGTVDTTGTSEVAIQSNGLDAPNFTVNVYEGAVVTAPATRVGIFMPSTGTVNVYGGTITGGDAIYISQGALNVSGGELIATGAAVEDYTAPTSGYEVSGAAITIVNRSTPVVSITGGTVTSQNGSAVASYSNTSGTNDPVTGFVSGGTFNTPLAAEYCASGYAPKDYGNGTYGVADHFTVTFVDYNGTTLQTDDNAAVGATPEYVGAAPTREGWTFKNRWTPEIVAVAGDATYTAVYEQDATPEVPVDVPTEEKPKTTVAVAVPQDCTADELIDTSNRVADDELKVYDKDDRRYYAWTLTGPYGEWVPANVYKIGDDSVSEGTKDVSEVNLKAGQAVWVTTTSDEAIKLLVKYTSDKAEVEVETGWNLVAPTTGEATTVLDLIESTGADDADAIVVSTTGAPRAYTKVGDEWGYADVEFVEKNGKTFAKPVRKTGNTDIPAGKGVWFVNGGDDKSINL